MNLLIIEDDIYLSEKIKSFFLKNKISSRIKLLLTYNDFLYEKYLINTYDIVLVDIILWKNKEKNWIDIIESIRKINPYIPIIIISWLDDILWLKLAFDKWANDYICKPFRLAELEVRVLKWFNKSLCYDNLWFKESIEYNWLKYDFWENKIYINNLEIILTKTNKYILLLFISKSEKLLSNIYLIEKIWWDSNIYERNLRVNINRLKKGLKPFWIDKWVNNIWWEWYILKK